MKTNILITQSQGVPRKRDTMHDRGTKHTSTPYNEKQQSTQLHHNNHNIGPSKNLKIQQVFARNTFLDVSFFEQSIIIQYTNYHFPRLFMQGVLDRLLWHRMHSTPMFGYKSIRTPPNISPIMPWITPPKISPAPEFICQNNPSVFSMGKELIE